jgi:DNA-directed RNA polymerase specialized sigma24 family protein
MAEALVNTQLRALERPVMRTVESRLRAEKVVLPSPDLEAAYSQAWHGVYQTITRGTQIENLTGLLVDITYKRSIDIYRQRNEAMQTEANLESHAVDLDLAEQMDDQRKIARLVERLRHRLNTNERNAVTLCVLHGYKRPEAAKILGVEEAAFQKVMDSATKKLAAVTAGIQARGCGGDEWSRALRAFALGLTRTDSPDYRRIAQHLTECASCERYVMGLRGLAVVLPPIGLPLGPLGSLLADIQRLITRAHGATTMSTATAQTTATVAGTTAVGSTAAGTGLASVLGGGAIKAAIVAAGIAAAGSLSVHATSSHHSRGRVTSRPDLSAIRASHLDTSAQDDEVSAIPKPLAAGAHSVGSSRPRLQATSSARSSVVTAEFGFEGSHQSTSPRSAAVASQDQHQIATAAAVSGSRSPSGESSAKFRVEDAGVRTASRASAKATTAEFGFEHAGRPE